MNTTRLFERLLKPNANHDSLQALFASIEHHINNLLSVRIGASSTCPDLGIPDLNIQYMTPYEANQYICAQIQEMLMKYETRVNKITVNRVYTRDTLVHSFSISCLLHFQGQDHAFQFSTQVDQH